MGEEERSGVVVHVGRISAEFDVGHTAGEIELPDGSVASGSLDPKGFARIEGIEPGQCKISFPDLDKDAWEKA